MDCSKHDNILIDYQKMYNLPTPIKRYKIIEYLKTLCCLKNISIKVHKVDHSWKRMHQLIMTDKSNFRGVNDMIGSTVAITIH